VQLQPYRRASVDFATRLTESFSSQPEPVQPAGDGIDPKQK
jgi:hypothetical protein